MLSLEEKFLAEEPGIPPLVRQTDVTDLPAPLVEAAAEFAKYVRLRSECEQYLEEHDRLRQLIELTRRGE